MATTRGLRLGASLLLLSAELVPGWFQVRTCITTLFVRVLFVIKQKVITKARKSKRAHPEQVQRKLQMELPESSEQSAPRLRHLRYVFEI